MTVAADRALIRRQFAAGRLTLDEALTAECCWRMPVWQLLASAVWCDEQRARRVARSVGLDADQALGELTNRQRDMLVLAFERERRQLTRRTRRRA